MLQVVRILVLSATLACLQIATAKETPVMVKDLSRDGGYPAEVTVVGSRVFYVSFDPAHGEELWVYDGTSAHIVADLEPGTGDFGPRDLVAMGSRVFFHGRGAHLAELWSSDGTAAGTTRIFTWPAASGFGIEGMRVAGNRLYFRGEDPTRAYPWELFTSDGTTSGTHELQTKGVPWLDKSTATLPDGRIFFKGYPTSGLGFAIWVSDGTQAGTRALTDAMYFGQMLRAAGSQVFFMVGANAQYGDLWATDGTVGGTRLVKSVSPTSAAGATNLMPLGSNVIFFADDRTHGMEPWISDGTAAGTHLLVDLAPSLNPGIQPNAILDDGLGHTTPVYQDDEDSIASADGKVYFTNSTSTGWDLWVCDGTPIGTQRVISVAPGPDGTAPQTLVPFGGSVFFLNADDSAGQELWVSDGTTAGTHRVRDFAPGPASSFPGDFGIAPGRAYFRAFDGDGAKLWTTDGTTIGTHVLDDRFTMSFDSVILNLTASGNRVFFNFGEYNAHVVSLWTSDGTDAGTQHLVGPVAPDSDALTFGSGFNIIPVPGGAALWLAPHSSSTALVYSDGTYDGSGLVRDFLTPDAAVTSPRNFVQLGGNLYFKVWLNTYEAPNWFKFDPVTVQVTDANIMPGGSWVGPWAEGSHLYFLKMVTLATMPFQQLIRTNGTPDTAVVLTPPSGIQMRGVSRFTDFGGRTYFNVDRFNQYEVWRTTADGTGIESFVAGRQNEGLERVNNRLIMTNADGVVSTDGTTQALLAPANAILAADGTRAYLLTSDPKASTGGTLWVTDGTIEGTRIVTNFGADTRCSFGRISRGVLYCVLWHDNSTVRNFWRSDGTAEGTYIVYSDPGLDWNTSLNENSVAVTANGRVFFVARDPMHGLELFRLDTEPTADAKASLGNSSVRARVVAADVPVIMGFHVEGSSPSVLARAAGPSLREFGVEDAAADPRMVIYTSASVRIGENDNWDAPGASAADAAVHTSVGAFAFEPGAADAAWTQTLTPGSYTVHVQGEAAHTVLSEVYLRNRNAAEVTNLSCRNQLQSGDDMLIAGFAVIGPGHRRVLIRVVGPGLTRFGVNPTASDPTLELHDGDTVIATNDNWQTQTDAGVVTDAMKTAGAFELEANSTDAAIVRDLSPGTYTVVARDQAKRGGDVLVEVYALP